MDNSKTLCHMAWDYPMFFMYLGNIGYCCRTPKINIDKTLMNEMKEEFWFNHPHFVNRRKELLNGVKSKDCQTCWQLEDVGIKSSRSPQLLKYFLPQHNESVKFNTKFEDYPNIQGIENTNYSNVIEIVLNNTCDAKCIYCSEWYSTQWYAEKSQWNEVSRAFSTIEQKRDFEIEESFWAWYKNYSSNSIRRFGFIGGEPLIIDALYDCFDKILEIHQDKPVKSYKQEICITTNLNTPPKYFNKFINYCKKLEKHFTIILQVSGENVEKELEYIRHGVKWDRFKSNIEYILQHTGIQIHFLPCLSLLSIPTFAKYLEYFYQLCQRYTYMKIHYNIVTHPLSISPMIAPKEFSNFFDPCITIIENLLKEYVKNDTIRSSYMEFLKWLLQLKASIENNPSDTELNDNSKEFFRYISVLDNRRNTDVLTTFPDIGNFYMSGKNHFYNSPKKIINIQPI